MQRKKGLAVRGIGVSGVSWRACLALTFGRSFFSGTPLLHHRLTNPRHSRAERGPENGSTVSAHRNFGTQKAQGQIQ